MLPRPTPFLVLSLRQLTEHWKPIVADYRTRPVVIDEIAVGTSPNGCCDGLMEQPMIEVRVRVPTWDEWDTQHTALVCSEGCAIRFVSRWGRALEAAK